jgi:hypothetical protein
MTVTHCLKTDTSVYEQCETGVKSFEIRKDDRDFQVGDILTLEEYLNKRKYTGRRSSYWITYILRGEEWGMQPGYVIMSIVRIIR